MTVHLRDVIAHLDRTLEIGGVVADEVLAAVRLSHRERDRRREEREPIFRELLGIACVTRAKLISDGIRVGRTVGIVPVDEKTARIDVRTEEDAWLANQLLSKR